MLKPFNKTSVGVDIADRTIEAVVLKKSGKKAVVVSYGRIRMPVGIVERGRIKKKERLARVFKKVLESASPEPINTASIVFGLPECQVYLHTAILKASVQERFKYFSQKEKNAYIKKEALKLIPIKESDLLFSYTLQKTEKKKLSVLIVASSKKVVQEWYDFFQEQGIEVVFDIESLALYRGLFTAKQKKSICIVDIGASTSNILIFDAKGLRYSNTVESAGTFITRAIAKSSGITTIEAEKQKIKEGLSSAESKIYQLISKKVDTLAQEILTLIKYYQTQTNKHVSEVVLTGGSSMLKGLPRYLAKQLSLPVTVGSSSLPLVQKSKTASQFFIEAIGLAKRGIVKKWSKDPVIESVKNATIMQAKRKKTTKDAASTVTHQSLGSELDVKPLAPETQSFKVPDEVIQFQKGYKLKKQKRFFFIILLIVIIALAFAFWYRSYEKTREEAVLSSNARFSLTQTLMLQVPLAVDPADYTLDRVSGIIIETVIDKADGYYDAVALAKANAEDNLQEGEKLWIIPINIPDNTNTVEFPIKVQWAVYSEAEANTLLLKELETLNTSSIEFEVSFIDVTGVHVTENPNIYLLSGSVTISLDELIKDQGKDTDTANSEFKEESNGSESNKNFDDEILEDNEKIIILTVTITKTPTGWLNVRKGPGTNFDIITKINPGENYPLLAEDGKWYSIQFGDSITGWIHSDYAEKNK